MALDNFTKLIAWQEAHKLVLMIYESTNKFPQKEQFCLTSQMIRAVVSISSNVAEGFGRNGIKEKINFYQISRGSLIEIQNQLIIAKDVGYLKEDEYKIIANQTVTVHKLINGLISSTKKRAQSSP